jgi:hypothetical protein
MWKRQAAWESLNNATTSFFNQKASNFPNMVADLAQSYKAMRCNTSMSFKTHFLDSFLRFLPRKYRGTER